MYLDCACLYIECLLEVVHSGLLQVPPCGILQIQAFVSAITGTACIVNNATLSYL